MSPETKCARCGGTGVVAAYVALLEEGVIYEITIQSSEKP